MKTRYMWKDLREIGLGDVNWIHLAQDERPLKGSCEHSSPNKH
jgi:hypothetical protein